MSSVVKKVSGLSFPFQTPDPFLFAVYHNDAYPRGNAKMEAPGAATARTSTPRARTACTTASASPASRSTRTAG